MRKANKNKMVRLTESDLRNIVKKSVNKILRESIEDGYEDIETFNVFTDYFSMSEGREELLNATLFDKNDRPVGKLIDLHFKHDTETNRLV